MLLCLVVVRVQRLGANSLRVSALQGFHRTSHKSPSEAFSGVRAALPLHAADQTPPPHTHGIRQHNKKLNARAFDDR